MGIPEGRGIDYFRVVPVCKVMGGSLIRHWWSRLYFKN
jgi:hypothetical protein